MMTKANTKYKTAKRKANVSERILITNVDPKEHRYANGDEFVVTEVWLDGDIHAKGMLIYYSEYEVIIEESPSDSERITLLETQVAELQAELQALKKRKKPKHLLTHYPTPNEQRKAVIERAKAFVADTLTKKASKSHDGAIVVGVYYAMPKFFVNAEKRVVTFVAVSPKYKHKRAKAIAKCAPDDVFNADIGKAIALGRALGLDVSEFENAPKPTEVVVGMVVKNTGCAGGTKKCTKVYPDKVWRGSGYIESYHAVITDDTEAQY